MWLGEKSIIVSDITAQGAKYRFRQNFVVHENGDLIPKIWEGSQTVYETIQNLEAQGYDLDETLVTLSRKGVGTNTKYFILPKPKTPANLISALKKLELIKLEQPKPQDQPEGDVPNHAEDIPF